MRRRHFSGIRCGASSGSYCDSQWAGLVPIYSYLIEHPEGLFVVDTGDNSPADRYERNVDGPVSTGPGGRS
jgi:glyoxylase-like metal-dependent hydrolase (beta-lactamase superfamily II)